MQDFTKVPAADQASSFPSASDLFDAEEMSEESALCLERLLKSAVWCGRLGTHIDALMLYKSLTGEPLLGVAEFERLSAAREAALINKARLVRLSPAFRREVLPLLSVDAACVGLMPEGVLNHPETPTYHRVVAVLLEADVRDEEKKTAERLARLKERLLVIMYESRSNRLACNLHAGTFRAALTGSRSLRFPSDLESSLLPGDPRRNLIRASKETFFTSKEEIAFLGAFLTSL
jgi:hypothetical protein